jgi:hypothetical protein
MRLTNIFQTFLGVQVGSEVAMDCANVSSPSELLTKHTAGRPEMETANSSQVETTLTSSTLHHRPHPLQPSTTEAPSEDPVDAQEKHDREASEFECNVCFEAATEPVVTVCGHLYCWGCLAEWLLRASICPVCKAGVKKETVRL